jgi:anti-sigma factor RsiW
VACENSEHLLRAYFDGELDLVRSLAFEEHLKTCPQCAAELCEQQALRDSLRTAHLYEPAPDRLRARVRAALPAQARPQTVSTTRRPLIEWLAIAAAILIAVFLGVKAIPDIGGQKQNLLAEEIVASHIRSLQPGHLMDVESTDQHTVKPWFDGKLDFAPPVVDLATQGFPLVGGRLDYIGRRNVAALVYQRQKHFINLFIWPEEKSGAKLPEVQTIQGYNVVFWSGKAMDYFAVSDLNSTELGQFANLLSR